MTAKLTDGRFQSTDGIVMFDGILYHAWYLKYHPEVFETGECIGTEKEIGNGDAGHIGLPLYQLPGNRWAASMGIYTQVSETIEYWNKRPNFFAPDKTDHLDLAKGIISDSMGQYRAYRTPCVIRTVKDGTIDFYCVGNKDAVIDLLSYVTAVGKKPSIGWGTVESWHIEESKEDYSLMHPKYGLMCPTPINEIRISGYAIMNYAVKPPYHNQKNIRRCYIPNVENMFCRA